MLVITPVLGCEISENSTGSLGVFHIIRAVENLCAVNPDTVHALWLPDRARSTARQVGNALGVADAYFSGLEEYHVSTIAWRKPTTALDPI